MDLFAEEEFDQRMRDYNLHHACARAFVSLVQLVSEGGIRIIKFTRDDNMLNDDEGWYSDTFLASTCKNCDYSDIYYRLVEVRFLVHLYHAQHRGDLNFEEY